MSDYLQVATVKKLYSGVRTAKGQRVYPGFRPSFSSGRHLRLAILVALNCPCSSRMAGLSAYVSDETGQLEGVCPGLPVVRSTRAGLFGWSTEPVWSRSGTELFYRNGRQYFSVPVSHAGETIKIGRPSLMFEGNFVIGSLFPGDPSRTDVFDGRRFITVMPAADTPQNRTAPAWDSTGRASSRAA